jgi:hypothetical protein
MPSPTLTRRLALALAVALPLLPAIGRTDPSDQQPVTYEKKDASGRLVSRIVFKPDGTIHHSSTAYGPRAARLTVEWDLDPVRDPVAEKRERFDEDGRIVERYEALKQDGTRTRTRTTFSYDASGRQTSTTVVE